MQNTYGNLRLNMRNLQFFAETGDAGAGSAEADNSQDIQEVSSDYKAPETQSELDSLINKANQKALENYKQGEAERIQTAIAEGIKKEKDYANLSAKERETAP